MEANIWQADLIKLRNLCTVKETVKGRGRSLGGGESDSCTSDRPNRRAQKTVRKPECPILKMGLGLDQTVLKRRNNKNEARAKVLRN